jgi:hypothetical protein
VPFALIVIAVLGYATGSPAYAVPITAETILLLLLFPLLYVLLQSIQADHPVEPGRRRDDRGLRPVAVLPVHRPGRRALTRGPPASE